MARRRQDQILVERILRWVASNPRRNLPIVVVVPILALFFSFIVARNQVRPPTDVADRDERPTATAPVAGPGGYLFCFWNVENLFDDRDDNRPPDDEQYDDWFARDRAALELKLSRLSEVLISLNDGRGPDILAACEVEGVRAAELLRDALNRRLADPSLHYRFVLMKEVNAGRHIAPVILTRLPVNSDQTRLLGSRLRILEGHVAVNGFDLVVIASHWTSRVSDKSGDRRDRYADVIYQAYSDLAARRPDVDLLVCGDFNDPPEEESVVSHLHAVADRNVVLHAPPGPGPKLLNLMAGKDPAVYGTLYHDRKRLVYDQIVVSRGLLDQAGWTCDPDSVATVSRLTRPGDPARRPWRFSNEKDDSFQRGYSDHFPVTVRLRVQGQ